MSLEICKLCDKEATPWFYVPGSGHICQDCYFAIIEKSVIKKNSKSNKILTDEEIKRIFSKSQYWYEVSKREDVTPLYAELVEETALLGWKILFILKKYAEENK